MCFFEDMTFEEQIGYVRHASILLGIHGAGISTLRKTLVSGFLCATPQSHLSHAQGRRHGNVRLILCCMLGRKSVGPGQPQMSVFCHTI